MHGGVDEDGVDELRDAHVLQHLAHVLRRHVVAVLRRQRIADKITVVLR